MWIGQGGAQPEGEAIGVQVSVNREIYTWGALNSQQGDWGGHWLLLELHSFASTRTSRIVHTKNDFYIAPFGRVFAKPIAELTLLLWAFA